MAALDGTNLTVISPLGDGKTPSHRGAFLLHFIYMRYLLLVIGGFILLMLVNAHLGGSPLG